MALFNCQLYENNGAILGTAIDRALSPAFKYLHENIPSRTTRSLSTDTTDGRGLKDTAKL